MLEQPHSPLMLSSVYVCYVNQENKTVFTLFISRFDLHYVNAHFKGKKKNFTSDFLLLVCYGLVCIYRCVLGLWKILGHSLKEIKIVREFIMFLLKLLIRDLQNVSLRRSHSSHCLLIYEWDCLYLVKLETSSSTWFWNQLNSSLNFRAQFSATEQFLFTRPPIDNWK